MKKYIEVVLEIILFVFLLLFPFSNDEINVKEIVFLVSATSLVLFNILIFSFFKKENISLISALMIGLFIYIFDKIDNYQSFDGIQITIFESLPLTTVLLSVCIITYLVKSLVTGEILVFTYTKYFALTSLLLIISTVLFYLLLNSNYQPNPYSDIQLLNKIVKYVLILLLLNDYLSKGSNIYKLGLGIIASMSTVLMMNIL